MYCQVWWPILEIGPLHLTHPSAHTHTAVSSEHTHREHTPGAVGSHCSSARGAIEGSVPCSRAPQSWYWRWREYCSFTIPTFNPCRTWDSNQQPLDYKSDSLTIRPRLPLSYTSDLHWATMFAIKKGKLSLTSVISQDGWMRISSRSALISKINTINYNKTLNVYL